MLTLTTRLLRFLLTLVVRLHLNAGRIALAFRTRFASLWGTFLSRARQSRTRLLKSEDPGNVGDNYPDRDRLQVSGHASVPEKPKEAGTLAALPVLDSLDWQGNVTEYQRLTSSFQIKFHEDPATPETGSRRYNLKPKQMSRNSEPPAIPPGQETLLSSIPPLPHANWSRHVHPEGNVFYYHKKLRIFTETDIFKREKEVLYCASALIQKAIDTPAATLDELTEISLNVDESGRCQYYFVDHRNRLLFWLQPMKPRDLGTDLEGFAEFSHIRYLVQSQYWSHCEFYPNNRILAREVFEDLRGKLNYAKTDMMTTDSSTSPFAQDELVAILDLINSLKDNEAISDSYSVWVIARIMAFFIENQFLNFSGQSCARLNADTTLFEAPDWNRRKVFKTANVLLFGSPNEHAVRLKRVWVDGIIIQPRWKEFVNRLTSELTRYTLFSTVMLAVNFSFLAVPGVTGSPASSIQTIIYCSIVSTIASIVFSFALLNVYNDPGIMVAGRAAKVMQILSEGRLGMPCLAITHSLPIASLIWAIVLFSAALAVQIFGPKERPTVTALGVECLVLVLLAGMGVVVMQLFYKDDDPDGGNEDTPEEETETPAHSRDDDIEMGSRNSAET